MALERIGLGAVATLDNRQFVQAAGKARDSLGRFVAGAREVPPVFDNMGQAAGRGRDALGRFVAGAREAPPVFKLMGGSFARASQQISAGARKISAGVKQLGAGLRNAALGFIPLTIAVGAGIKTAAGFEKQMDAVSSITRGTAGDMAELEAKAKQMGIQSVFSATQSGEAMEFMARAGATTIQITEGLSGVMAAAAAESIDLATAADIVAQTTKIMGREWEQASNTADILVLTSAKTNTNIRALGEAMRFGGQAAANMGFTLEETSATMGLLADAGLRGSIGGTALMNMFNKLNRPTAKAAKLMKDWEIKLTNADGSMRSISDITEQFSTRINKIPDAAKRAATTTEIFGVRGQRAFQALAKVGKEETDKLVAAMFNASEGIGAAQEAAEKRLDNFSGALILFKSSVASASIGLFGPLLKDAQTSVEGITNSLNNVLFSLNSLQAIQKKGAVLQDESTIGLADNIRQRLVGIGLTEREGFSVQKNLALLSKQAVAGEKLSDADRRQRAEALDNINKVLQGNKDLSAAERERANQLVSLGIREQGTRLAAGDAIRAQIFEIEELTRIEKEHGSTAVAIAMGVQDAIASIKGAWTKVTDAVKQAGQKLEERFGPGTIQKITKIVIIVGLIAAAMVPVILALVTFGFAITGLGMAFAALGTIASGAFAPVLVLLGALFLAFTLLRRSNETWFQTAKRVFLGIKAFVLDLWLGVVRPFWLGIKDAFIPIIEELGAVWGAFVAETKLALGDLFGFFAKGTDQVQTDWRTVGQNIVSVIGAVAIAVLQVLRIVVPVFALMAAAVFTLGKIVFDFLINPFRILFELVKNIFAAFGAFFDGNIAEGFARLGLALVDLVLSPLRLILRTAITLADAVNISVPEGIRTFAEKGVTGLVFPKAPEQKQVVKVIEEGARKVAEKRITQPEIATKAGKTLEELQAELVGTMDLKAQEKARAEEKPEITVNMDLTDKRTLEIDNKLCIDGEPMAVATEHHRQEIKDRAGFKATPWQRRIAVETGADIVRSSG